MAEGPGPRLNITSRCRVRFEVMFDSREGTTAAADSGLESDCPREVLAARSNWQQELPGVGTGTTCKAQHMVC